MNPKRLHGFISLKPIIRTWGVPTDKFCRILSPKPLKGKLHEKVIFDDSSFGDIVEAVLKGHELHEFTLI